MKKSAFPIYVTGGPESGYHPGMSLREYYAGQALAGMIVRQNDQAIPYCCPFPGQFSHGL